MPAANPYSHILLTYTDSKEHIICPNKLLGIIYQSYVIMNYVY